MLTTIDTIEQLKKNLNLGPGYGGYAELVKAINLSSSEWESFCTWKDHKYTRNCVSSCDSYEALIMCWKKGQESPIHSYNFQESWIKVLKGKLLVETFNINKDTKEIDLESEFTIGEKEFICLNDSVGFHRVKNISKEETISLHINIEKVEQWDVFQESTKDFKTVTPHTDSYSIDCI